MRSFDPLLTSAFAGDIGVAREDITPPLGIYSRNWGAAKHDVAEGVHRSMTLTALALSEGGGAPLILVAADLGWWMAKEDEWRVRGGLLEALQLDPSRVLFALSHTHAGANLYTENKEKPGGALIAPFLDRVREAAIRASKAALDSRRPARLAWRYGRCNLAINRDLPSKDGKRFVLGPNPTQPADDTVLVGKVEDAGSGRVIATLVNYACHPVTLAWQNKLLSPDYVGAMREMVESAVGGAPCLFLQGASGELSPADQNQGNTAVADSAGRRLGHSVLAVLEGWTEACLSYDGLVESGAPSAVFSVKAPILSRELRASLTPVNLRLRDELPTIAQVEESLKTCDDRATRERLWRKRGIRRNVGDGTSADTPLWAWRLGEALLIAQPSEAFSCFQMDLRSHFQPRAVAVLNTTNGPYNTYLPPRNHYGRDEYEVWVSPFGEGCLEKATAEAISSAGRLLAKKDA